MWCNMIFLVFITAIYKMLSQKVAFFLHWILHLAAAMVLFQGD